MNESIDLLFNPSVYEECPHQVSIILPHLTWAPLHRSIIQSKLTHMSARCSRHMRQNMSMEKHATCIEHSMYLNDLQRPNTKCCAKDLDVNVLVLATLACLQVGRRSEPRVHWATTWAYLVVVCSPFSFRFISVYGLLQGIPAPW